MVLMDFGSFSHLLEKYELFIKLSKTVIFGHFWAKSMGYSPWFWWILGVFHTFWKNMKFFQSISKKFWAIFEQKAWAIAHGFDGFWVFFTPFGKIWIIYECLSKMSKLAIFEQKAWAIAHGFDRFWVIFTPFGNYEIFSKMSKMGHFWAKSMGYSPWFWSILGVFHTRNLEIFQKWSILGHFWAKSMGYSPWFWWILGVFHTFWKNMNYLWSMVKIQVIFGHFGAKSMGYSPWFWSILGVFHTFWKIMKFFQKCQKWVIFEQKAWAIAHGFDGFWVFFTPFGKYDELFIKLSKHVIFGHFWAKSMGYSPWFWWILGVFHTFWKLWNFSKMVKNGSFLSKKHGL